MLLILETCPRCRAALSPPLHCRAGIPHNADQGDPYAVTVAVEPPRGWVHACGWPSHPDRR